MKKILLLAMIVMTPRCANAQRRGVLLDMETRQPISGATIPIKIKDSQLIFMVSIILMTLLLQV